MESCLNFLVSNPLGNLLVLSFIHIITWCYCLTLKGWVSDDIEGIARFSDRFHQEKDQLGNIVKEEKIDSYEIEHGGKKYKIKNTQWNPSLEFPSCFMRWFRLMWGRRFKEIGKDSKGHTIYGWIQDARKHHLLNILFQLGNIILGYNLLTRFFGQQLAFYSILLFSVHPCSVQPVGWISGVNYLISLFGALLTFNLVLYVDNQYLLYSLVALSSVISCMTLLPGCFNFVILLFLGFPKEAAVAGLVGLIFLWKLGRYSVNFRVNAFKAQQMGASTRIYVRKLIIMVKTFGYYFKLILFPKRLGLFHTWGYHFEDTINYVNGEFWFGFLTLVGYLSLGFLAPDPVKLGVLWSIVYLLIFSNFITAQQFVSERYAFISTFGTSLILAYYLQSYPVIIAFIAGICIMRIWVHLPSFQNEVRFYEINNFNFPNSEVSMGNLGVAYLNHGMPNRALDTWREATAQNVLYDVPWYNLYSLCKQNGDLMGAKKFLTMCLNAKTIHFPEQWNKEMQDLDKIIKSSVSINELTKQLNQSIKGV